MNEQMTTLLSILLNSSTQAQVFHRQVTGAGSFSAHSALGTYYDEIIELVDTLTESYQGKYGIVIDYKTYALVNWISCEQVIAYFEELCNQVYELRKVFTDSYIQNQIDQIEELLYQTKYRLKFLA
jgi:DNA-binding ferritin-like protein